MLSHESFSLTYWNLPGQKIRVLDNSGPVILGFSFHIHPHPTDQTGVYLTSVEIKDIHDQKSQYNGRPSEGFFFNIIRNFRRENNNCLCFQKKQ